MVIFENTNPNYCKICFKRIEDPNLYNFMNKKVYLCNECMTKISAKFNYFKINGYKGLAIFEYDDEIRKLIYQFKGCFDIELAQVFVERYINELRLMFHNYILVPAPSYEEDDKIREFNHVLEIFSKLNLKMCRCIRKITPFKQASHNSNDRNEIRKCLKLVNGKELQGKRVLIVDDVLTTGSTIKSIIELIQPLKPKEIRVFVISRTTLKKTDT